MYIEWSLRARDIEIKMGQDAGVRKSKPYLSACHIFWKYKNLVKFGDNTMNMCVVCTTNGVTIYNHWSRNASKKHVSCWVRLVIHTPLGIKNPFIARSSAITRSRAPGSGNVYLIVSLTHALTYDIFFRAASVSTPSVGRCFWISPNNLSWMCLFLARWNKTNVNMLAVWIKKNYIRIYIPSKNINTPLRHSLIIFNRMNAKVCKFHISYISKSCIDVLKIIWIFIVTVALFIA